MISGLILFLLFFIDWIRKPPLLISWKNKPLSYEGNEKKWSICYLAMAALISIFLYKKEVWALVEYCVG